MFPLDGVGVALVTPFRNGQIDFSDLASIIEHTLRGGVDFLVSLGTTGETATLSWEESVEVLRFTVETVAGRVPVVTGLFAGNDTAAVLARIEAFDFTGIHALLSASPAYNKPTQEGIYQHYMALAEASPRPIIIYNVPGRTASNVQADTILRLARASESFIGVKQANTNLMQSMVMLKNRPSHFRVLSGDDPFTLALTALGGDGVISVIANAFPREFSALVRAARQGDLPQARHYNDLLLDIHRWLYIEGNPAGIKTALHLLGLCSPEVRLPLVPLRDETKRRLEQACRHAGLLNSSVLG